MSVPKCPKQGKDGDLTERAAIMTGHTSHSPTRTSVLGRELNFLDLVGRGAGTLRCFLEAS
eukprot:1143959-Pelagomonas_calceolata.AAC.3